MWRTAVHSLQKKTWNWLHQLEDIFEILEKNRNNTNSCLRCEICPPLYLWANRIEISRAYLRGFIASWASDSTGLVWLAGGEYGFLTSMGVFIKNTGVKWLLVLQGVAPPSWERLESYEGSGDWQSSESREVMCERLLFLEAQVLNLLGRDESASL